jgi:dolichol-phosphate mannosyltransferase
MLIDVKKGFDIVYGVRSSRQGETGIKKFSANLFYRTINCFSPVDIPLDAGDFRLVSSKAREEFLKITDQARLNREIWSWIGLPQSKFYYDRPPRAFGATKYNWKRMLKLAFDGFTAVGLSVMVLPAVVGLILFALGILGLIFSNGTTPKLFLSFSVILVATSLIGLYAAGSYRNICRRPQYLIKEIVERNQAGEII